MSSFTNRRFITAICLCLLTVVWASTLAGQTPSTKPAAPASKPSASPSAKPTTPAATASPKPSASPAAKPSAGPTAKPSTGPAAKPTPGAKPSVTPAAPVGPLPANAPDGLYALFDTSKGVVVASLDSQRSPLSVIAFVGLAEGTIKSTKSGPFYDGLKFHRVVEGQLVQAGSADGSDAGGPGFSFFNEIDPTLAFEAAGTLAFANAGPGTNGSQFFITESPAPWLAGRNSAFGQVVSGQDIVNRIVQGDTITKLTILRKGKAAESFKADQAAFDSAAESLADRNQKKIADQIAKLLPGAQKTPDGRWYVVEKAGNGASPVSGQTITMNYTGRFLSGRQFDASPADAPASVKLGTGRIISGWDLTLSEMKIGEKRSVAIPPEQAFGDSGVENAAENAIPPNSWVIITIELLSAST